MFVNGFHSVDFLSRSHGCIHDVIIQAMRSRCLAVCNSDGLGGRTRLATKALIFGKVREGDLARSKGMR